ncbi:unnamed protein product, partial [Amoebophrya sp. A120]
KRKLKERISALDLAYKDRSDQAADPVSGPESLGLNKATKRSAVIADWLETKEKLEKNHALQLGTDLYKLGLGIKADGTVTLSPGIYDRLERGRGMYQKAKEAFAAEMDILRMLLKQSGEDGRAEELKNQFPTFVQLELFSDTHNHHTGSLSAEEVAFIEQLQAENAKLRAEKRKAEDAEVLHRQVEKAAATALDEAAAKDQALRSELEALKQTAFHAGAERAVANGKATKEKLKQQDLERVLEREAKVQTAAAQRMKSERDLAGQQLRQTRRQLAELLGEKEHLSKHLSELSSGQEKVAKLEAALGESTRLLRETEMERDAEKRELESADLERSVRVAAELAAGSSTNLAELGGHVNKIMMPNSNSAVLPETSRLAVPLVQPELTAASSPFSTARSRQESSLLQTESSAGATSAASTELSSRIAKLQAQLWDARHRAENAEVQASRLQEEVAQKKKVEEELSETKQTLAKETAEVEHLQDEQRQLKEEKTFQEAKLERKKSDLTTTAQQQSKQVEELTTHLEEQRHFYEEQLQQFRQRTGSAEHTSAESQRQVGEMRTMLAELKRKVQEKEEENTDLKTEDVEHEQQQRAEALAMAKKIEGMTAELSANRATVAKMREQVQGVLNEAAVSGTQGEKAGSSPSKLDDSLQKDVQENIGKIMKTGNPMVQSIIYETVALEKRNRERRLRDEAELTAARKEVATLTAELRSVQAQLGLEEHNHSEDTTHASGKERILQGRVTELENQLSAAEGELTEYRQEHTQDKEVRQELESDYASAEKDLEYFQADNARLRSELRQLTEKYNRESLTWWTDANEGEKLSEEEVTGLKGKNDLIGSLQQEIKDLKDQLRKAVGAKGGNMYDKFVWGDANSTYPLTDVDVGADLGKVLDIVDDMQERVEKAKALPSYSTDAAQKKLVKEMMMTVDAIRKLLLRASA